MNFAVLASGNGSNLQAIIDACKKGTLKAGLALVLSDKKEAFVLKRAADAGIKAVHISPKDFSSREDFDRKLVEVLNENKIDFVVLAGYMRILSPVFIRAFQDKILNIHPALLPAFKGGHAIKDALAYGVKVTGVTVHLVDEEVDNGAIIAQVPVEIFPSDTEESLAERIHKAEHQIYPAVIHQFAQGKFKIQGRTVKLIA